MYDVMVGCSLGLLTTLLQQSCMFPLQSQIQFILGWDRRLGTSLARAIISVFLFLLAHYNDKYLLYFFYHHTDEYVIFNNATLYQYCELSFWEIQIYLAI